MTAPLARLTSALADRYRVERELGQGGMATVYLASDLRHDRQVALKVLRPDLAAVIGASRFLAEIKTTANLQHPHILPLHDSGEVDGTVYYVMPFIEGESLRDRLLREKQLPVDEAVRIAVEVAGALEYAHQHKVIHRDIKPENILLQGGHALVADFGIALAASKTEGGSRMTETGMSLGTPFYMSPEQAMGEREITGKSDVYALGCVLYEMLTGEPPFTGPTAQAIVARVMTEEPRSLTLQRRTVPRHVEAAVHRALSKLPADRFASAAGFAHALLTPGALTLPAEPAAGSPGARGKPGIATWGTGAAALLALAASGFLLGRRTAPTPAPRLTQLVVDAPDSTSAISRCCGAAVALSPDGNTLVFVVTKQGGGMLYRRVLGRIEAEPIPGTEGGATPFFSPDSRWLGFFANGRIRKVALAGGPALPIASIQTMTEASWGEGDVIVFGAGAASAGGARLYTVPAAGGTPQPLTTPDSTTRHSAPALLPGGRAALFTIRDTTPGNEAVRMGLVDLASRKIDTLGFGMRPRYASGYLVFTGADNTLLAQPFDLKRRKPTGQAVAILDHIAIHGNLTHEFAVSQNGGLVYQPAGGVIGGERLKLAGNGATSTIPLPGRGADNLEDPAFSPDGRRLALRIVASAGGVGSNNDLWLLNRQQGTLERFTVGGGANPVWSRDGRRIAYTSPSGIYVRPADQTAPPQLVIRGGQRSPGSWLPDGRSLVFWDADRGATRSDIGIVTLGDSVPRWLVTTEFRERHPQVSPNGRWLAYSSDLTGLSEVYVQPLSGPGARVQVSTAGGESPRWSPDGRTLYYAVGNSLVGAALAPGAGFQVTGRKSVVENGITDLNVPNVNWDIQPDGKHFLYIDQTGGGNLRLVWILDWPELVRTMATAR